MNVSASSLVISFPGRCPFHRQTLLWLVIPPFLYTRKLQHFHKQPLLSWPLPLSYCDYLPLRGLMAFVNSLIEFSAALGCVAKGHMIHCLQCPCSHTMCHNIIKYDHNQPVKLLSVSPASPSLSVSIVFLFLSLIAPSLCTGHSQCNYIWFTNSCSHNGV